jgi:AcrR family transcriptional regulator
MPTRSADAEPSRGHKKRARTRNQLIDAGVQVLARKGESLTISDVVAEAQVSNGTFYNYFADREELIDALAEHSLLSLAARTAVDTTDKDPARRFAFATRNARPRTRPGDVPFSGSRATDARSLVRCTAI